MESLVSQLTIKALVVLQSLLFLVGLLIHAPLPIDYVDPEDRIGGQQDAVALDLQWVWLIDCLILHTVEGNFPPPLPGDLTVFLDDILAFESLKRFLTVVIKEAIGEVRSHFVYATKNIAVFYLGNRVVQFLFNFSC